MKRFTATEKWAKQWFQELPPHLKCFWLYICDNTDAAGVWEPNYRLASFQIGQDVTAADLVQFGERVETLEDGKIHVLAFVEFQYGNLSKDCKAHVPVFRAIEKHRLSKGYPKAIHSLQEKEKEKEEVQEKEGESAERGSRGCDFSALPKSLDSPVFKAAWTEYVTYRREAKLGRLQQRSVESRWKDFEMWGVEDAVSAIHTAIANGYQGIFPPKPNGKKPWSKTVPIKESDMPKVERYE